MGCCNDLFGIWSQRFQRHVLYISENYNILMKNSIIGDLYIYEDLIVLNDYDSSLSLFNKQLPLSQPI